MHPTDVEMLKNAKEGDRKVILITMTGRPLWIDDALPNVNAAVAAFLPGTEGGPGIMDVLSGDVNPTGKLSVAWPKHKAQLPNPEADDILFPMGFGLDFSDREL